MSAAEAAEKQADQLRNKWITTESAARGGEEGGGSRRFRRGDCGGERSRGAGERIDLPGHQREDALEGHGNPLSSSMFVQGVTHMKIRRRDFLKLSGAALSGCTHPRRARRRHAQHLRPRTLRQCAHPAHDRHACAAAAGVLPRAQRQYRNRRDGRPAAASGGQAFLDRFGIRPDSADAYAFTSRRFREGRAALRQARRLRASEDADRPPAQRCRPGPLGAARRRRPLAGHGAGQRHEGRRHGGGGEPARHRGDDRPLGVHLWRGGAARQSRALQGRVPGAERIPHRGGEVQRRQGVRSRLGPRVQAVLDARTSAAFASR